MITIPISMLIVVIILRTGIRVRIALDSEIAYVNEEFDIMLEVENRSFFPVTSLCVSYSHTSKKNMHNRKKEKVYITVPPRSKKTVVQRLKFEHCMQAEVFLNKYVVYDYLRFWGIKKRLKIHVPVSIIPQIQEYCGCTDMIREYEDLSSDRYSQVKPGSDPSEVFGIKEYAEGDKIRNIHWKLSSKMDKIMVKQLSLPVNDSLSLIIDMDVNGRHTDIMNIDKCLESFFAFAYRLLESGFAFNIYCYNGSLINHFVEDSDNLIMAMGEIVKFQPIVEDVSAIDYFIEENSKDRKSAAYFTPKLTTEKITKLDILSDYNDVWVYTSGNWDGFYYKDIQMLQTGTGVV